MCLFRNKKKAVNHENKIWSESPLSTDSPAERLYKDLWSRRDELSKGFFRTQYDKDEDIAIISEAIYGWWKQQNPIKIYNSIPACSSTLIANNLFSTNPANCFLPILAASSIMWMVPLINQEGT